jgi:hypothetical protein
MAPKLPPGLSPGWWFSATPLKNDGLRQLGVLFPIYGRKKKSSKPPNSLILYPITTLLHHFETKMHGKPSRNLQ